MALKRPESEIVRALNSASDAEARAQALAQREAEHAARAREYCASIGLLRGEDESYDDWVNRVRKHLRSTVYGRLVDRRVA